CCDERAQGRARLSPRRQGRQLWRPYGGDEHVAQRRLSQGRTRRPRRTQLMAANAFALHEPLDEHEVARWSVAAMAIVVLHVAAIVIAMIWFKAAPPEQGVTLPAILVDMAPATTAPQSMPLDVAPGPVMQQADASPPEPVQQEVVEETIAPTPPQEK